nr:uncharacterized protein LOC111771466 isoform X2 [Equus caballus]
MERLSHSVFHSFGLAHTRCVSGSSGLTDHFQKFLRIRERTSSPEPLDLYELASKLFFLQLCWAVHPKSSLLADFYHHHPLQDLWWQSPVQVILWACTEKRVELEPTVKSRQTRPANFLSDSFNLSRNQLLYFSCDARGKPGNSDFAFSELQSFRPTWTPFVKADVAQHQVQAGGFLFTGSATKISSVPCLYKVTCFLGGG